jgi:acyl-[acyl-carrier-protein] desaturase
MKARWVVPAPDPDPDLLLRELEPTARRLLERHLAVAEEWMPHEYVPWGRGRDFAGLGGEPWAPGQSGLTPEAQAALQLNLLTEDNLPSYHRDLATVLGRDSAWGAWVGRWTAEEARHASSIRDYLVVSRAVDPDRLERLRLRTVETGFDIGAKPLLHVWAYLAMQELATRVAHRNTGQHTGDPVADRLLARIAMDENLHMVFYRGLVDAALELAPDQVVRAIADEVAGFTMPGAVVPGYGRLAARIALAGIYDLRLHHDEVVLPLVRHWRVFELTGLTARGEAAREELAATLAGLDDRARRFVARREESRTRAARRDSSPSASQLPT